MNRIFIHILTFCLLITASASFATDITHDFATKFDKTLFVTGSNKIGTTTDDGIIYKCAGTAEFGYKSDILCIKLSAKNDSVTISPPIPKLSEMWIYRVPSAAGDTKLKVCISEDGSSWTEIPSDKMDYSNKDYIKATIPVRAYYLKIYNSSSTEVGIKKIKYTYLDCNCFSVTP